jgi:hypothetical protein
MHSAEASTIQRAFLKMLDGFGVPVAFFESIAKVLMFPVMVSRVLQFSHSFFVASRAKTNRTDLNERKQESDDKLNGYS